MKTKTNQRRRKAVHENGARPVGAFVEAIADRTNRQLIWAGGTLRIPKSWSSGCARPRLAIRRSHAPTEAVQSGLNGK